VAFFLVINLVIAIIVEAYLKVRTKVEDLKADDEFFHDVGMTLLVLVKRRINGWPSDHKLLLALESCRLRALGPRQMMVVMPDWEDQCSVTSFFGHYKQCAQASPARAPCSTHALLTTHGARQGTRS
jgi:hypothetical protein